MHVLCLLCDKVIHPLRDFPVFYFSVGVCGCRGGSRGFFTPLRRSRLVAPPSTCAFNLSFGCGRWRWNRRRRCDWAEMPSFPTCQLTTINNNERDLPLLRDMGMNSFCCFRDSLTRQECTSCPAFSHPP